MKSPAVSYDNGQVTTLMSTDADSLDGVGEMIHEIWAQIIEVTIGVTLLATQVGWIWPLPLFLIYFVKMLGYQSSLTSRIQELREEELWAASRLRWVMVYYNMSANALGIFSPAITLVISALISVARGGKLDTETAFTTIAILSMVTHPANMVMTIVPRVVAAFAGFERIQTFLLQPSLQDTRQVLSENTRNDLLWDWSNPAIQIQDLRIGREQLVLRNINMQIAAGTFAIISGPTGSGKSTLLRAILGEVVPVQGSIALSTRSIAYCAQKPWLQNGTIKEAICGTTNMYSDREEYHERWYHEVVEICCLTHDLKNLPDGDQTQIGSKGLNLSGGQRQRVALARALFAKCDILLLDDTFSGLDGETERTIFKNLFGTSGLIRRLRTTTILVSNSSQCFHAADHIVVLKDHEILDQGNWQIIQFKAAFSTKFSSSSSNNDNAILAASFEKLNNQLRTRDETEIDLARKTGDPTLYGSRLHERLLNIVTSAPLSYFSRTDVGSILNRFSQDMQLVDKQLPSALQTVMIQIFKLLMQVILLCVAEKWLALSLPACVLLVYVIQKAYLRTSRQLRFLELESRAGVFSNFLETVEGLETIRSFGWSKAMIDANVLSVDNSQRPEFLLLCLQRWLNIVLDLLAAAIATGAVTFAVAFREHVSGAQVGIALNIMLVANTTLLRLVGNWTTLETSLGAIARLKSLETTPFEGGHAETSEPPEDWPSRGNIEFKNIIASYQSGSVALQNLSLNVPAGQKLVVCGRTGSGKSTLLLTLLRLLDLQSGKIELDGIDIKHVRLDLLRQRCFIAVSQDPLLLPNETLRFNLDPDTSVTDDALVDALTETGLWLHFLESNTSYDEEGATIIDVSGDFDKHPILHCKLALFQELSVGQCQLFALCRALVKARFLRSAGLKPIIALDEVTSSLDVETESTVYEIVDREFTKNGHTVIIIAHRLGALEKYMKVGRNAVALIVDGKLQVIQDIGPNTLQLLGQE
ncbi:ABC transporter, integral membrane type 1 [Penicillium occitanis (nom. inval.)]|nr:hypothetical protein PENOC_028440 [Penicillium occitanis (nom. inval.)]PCH08268.1 ABC transporter, integral membrane type 1 [Penicillium occitanis (nom. inval.)]